MCWSQVLGSLAIRNEVALYREDPAVQMMPEDLKDLPHCSKDKTTSSTEYWYFFRINVVGKFSSTKNRNHRRSSVARAVSIAVVVVLVWHFGLDLISILQRNGRSLMRIWHKHREIPRFLDVRQIRGDLFSLAGSLKLKTSTPGNGSSKHNGFRTSKSNVRPAELIWRIGGDDNVWKRQGHRVEIDPPLKEKE